MTLRRCLLVLEKLGKYVDTSALADKQKVTLIISVRTLGDIWRNYDWELKESVQSVWFDWLLIYRTTVKTKIDTIELRNISQLKSLDQIDISWILIDIQKRLRLVRQPPLWSTNGFRSLGEWPLLIWEVQRFGKCLGRQEGNLARCFRPFCA